MSTEEWRRLHRERMAEFRKRKRVARKCYRCPLPASPGRRMCPDHLAEDKKRVSKAKRAAKKAKR